MIKILNELHMKPQENKAIQKLNDSLPNKIIDIHTHVFLQDHIINKSGDNLYTTMTNLYDEFSFEDLQKTNYVFFENKIMHNVVFGMPNPNSDIQTNNTYIQTSNPLNITKFLLWDKKNIPYTIDQLHSWFRKWLKMYSYSHTDTNIIDVFPDHILQNANNLWLPIILHLPLSIIHNIDELVFLAKKYPYIRFIIAHWGNIQKCFGKSNEYGNSLEKANYIDNIYFDVSWVNSKNFLAILLNKINKNKFLYWSDLPIWLMKWIILPWRNNKLKMISKSSYPRINKTQNDEIIKFLHINMKEIINVQTETIKLLLSLLKDKEIEQAFYLNSKSLLSL